MTPNHISGRPLPPHPSLGALCRCRSRSNVEAGVVVTTSGHWDAGDEGDSVHGWPSPGDPSCLPVPSGSRQMPVVSRHNTRCGSLRRDRALAHEAKDGAVVANERRLPVRGPSGAPVAVPKSTGHVGFDRNLHLRIPSSPQIAAQLR